MTDVSVWEEARQRDANIDAIQFDGKENTTKAWVYNEFGKKVVREVREDLPPVLSTAAGAPRRQAAKPVAKIAWRPHVDADFNFSTIIRKAIDEETTYHAHKLVFKKHRRAQRS